MDLFISMEAFVRAAEAQSFANAARQLGVAKSVVTSRVKQLEEHFNVALFHRSTRAVRLSEVGESYYRDCAQLVNKVHELSGRTSAETHPLSGPLLYFVSLRISTDAAFSMNWPTRRASLRRSGFIAPIYQLPILRRWWRAGTRNPGHAIAIKPAVITRDDLVRNGIHTIADLESRFVDFRRADVAKAGWIPEVRNQ